MPKTITIMGAGLVGSMLAIILARRGHRVNVFEKRPDLRKTHWEDGRTINLALSQRGWNALKRLGIAEEVTRFAIPMPGRMIHDVSGKLAFQPYGKAGQSICSTSRMLLNQILMNQAEAEGNVQFYFEKKCHQVDVETATVHLTDLNTGTQETITADLLVGADGAFSIVRSALQRTERFNYEQHFIEHGYKELTIPPRSDGSWAIEKGALHIWPRGHFMLIALPNPDGSFTCTLFFPYEGETSFATLRTEADLLVFFQKHFPDILPLMPNVAAEYFTNPTSALVTIRCYPWQYKSKTLLIGDAAHAIVPFFGQGMNAGFEDCVVFEDLLDPFGDDWEGLLNEYQRRRKPNAEAIADLALANFVEMRDKVADPKFLLRKKVDALLHDRFPNQWTPLYTMIAFSHQIPYAEAQRIGQAQDRVLDEIMKVEGIEESWHNLDFTPWLANMPARTAPVTG